MSTFRILVFGDVSLVFEPANKRKKNAVESQFFAVATFLFEHVWATEEVCIYIRTVR
jgi:hypothetical protein